MIKNTQLQKLFRLLQTVRHLRLQQIVFQLWYRLFRGSMPSITSVSLRGHTEPQAWIGKPTCWEPGTAFTFLNERRTYHQNLAWEDDGAGKLWLYNLHYFDCLVVHADKKNTTLNTKELTNYQQQCAQLIDDWVVKNTDSRGTGWEPYPTSLRIVNWIKWHLQGPGLSTQALESLAQQTKWLAGRLEYHILANHLFANAKALVFAGLFFDQQQGAAWLAKGASLVTRELTEQLLADGAHFELSPMYHAILVEDVLDMLNLANSTQNSVSLDTLNHWRTQVQNMLQWQQAMLHPDGDIAFFNDAALDIARTSVELTEYALRTKAIEQSQYEYSSTYLEASGYATMHKGLFTVIADVAKVGPDYQPGHAHADTLSCEMSLGDDRVFVNAGTSTYVKGSLRDWQRSTAAHNTVELSGHNSSDVWDGFRVARRAYPADVQWFNNQQRTSLTASHNGYRFLDGNLKHNRQWELTEQYLQITDRVVRLNHNRSPQSDAMVARWLLHPDVELLGSNRLKTPSGHELEWSVHGGDAEVQSAHWYPRFGTEQTTQCLVIRATVGTDLVVTFRLLGLERSASNKLT